MVDLKPPSVQEAVAADALFPTETVEEGWKGHTIPPSPRFDPELLNDKEAEEPYLLVCALLCAPTWPDFEASPPSFDFRMKPISLAMSRRTVELNTPKILSRLEKSKVKRGVSGFANGKRVSALPDTGSLRNIVSQTFAREMNLKTKDAPSTFRLGNSKEVRSLGTINLDWAFLDRPKTLSKIVCDVLPDCTYPLILGSQFLAATQTLSKYKSRLTKCLFSLANVLHVNLLGGDTMRIRGRVGQDRNAIAVSAVPDTGAEGNVMSY
ncbi:MAG: hypothetical protein Q9196_007446, partial [Gyalolechia fulgens]